jgi:uncharacterized membrane protein YfcA
MKFIVLAIAAFASGFVNAVGGGGSLIAFPALLAFGYEDVAANVTTTVALWPGYIGGAIAYREELQGQRGRFVRLAISGGIGAVAGATILLVTPASLFKALVPYLVLAGCVLLAVQPRLQRRIHHLKGATGEERSPFLHAGSVVAGAYGAYFGAGLGLILLALLALFITDHLQRLNGLKTLLSVLINSIALIAFALFGPVVWSLAPLMAVSSLIGGRVGGAFARKLHPDVLRTVIVLFGVAVAIRLFFR